MSSTTEFTLNLAETDTQSRLEWIATLDELESLKPRAVVAGHKVPENEDDPGIIGETRQYIRDFNRLDETTTTARQLYDQMLELYPNRVNPGSLWGAANAAKKHSEKDLGSSGSEPPREEQTRNDAERGGQNELA
jgi:hypothetical protein